MKLSEYINARLKDLGMTRTDLVNKFDLDWSTLSGIDHDKQIRKATQEKLARGLQCSMGDIQACLAELPDERRKVRARMNELPREETEVVMEMPTPVPDFLTRRWSPEDDTCETLDVFKARMRRMCMKELMAADNNMPAAKIFEAIGKLLLKEFVE